MATMQGLRERSSYDRFTAGLEVAGMKVTSQRRAICQALAEMEGYHHPTAQEVFEAARRHHQGVSLATVYNTLNALRDLGLVYELGGAADGALHYELDTGPHLNLLCVRCKRIFDFPEVPVDGLAEEVARRSGFEIMGARLLYYGFCPDCRTEEAPR